MPQHVRVRRLNRKWAEARLQGLGWVRLRQHRALGGGPRSATVRLVAGEWTISVTVDADVRRPSAPTGPPWAWTAGSCTPTAASAGEFLDAPRLAYGHAIVALEALSVTGMTASAHGGVDDPGTIAVVTVPP